VARTYPTEAPGRTRQLSVLPKHALSSESSTPCTRETALPASLPSGAPPPMTWFTTSTTALYASAKYLR
jgi:hypothetical protein